MGRPRAGTNPRITVSFSLDPSTVEWLDAYAKRESISRSEAAQRLIAIRVEDLNIEATDRALPPQQETAPVAPQETVPQQETTTGQRIQNGAITYTQAAQNGCGHPRNQRTNLGWGTRCNVCNAILKP